MDRLDKSILAELMLNSRIPYKVLAKKLKVSREVVNYRIAKLIKDKIILNFTTEINYRKLGYIAGSIYLNIEETKQDEFTNFLSNSNYISWAVELSGTYNFAFSILGKDPEDVDRKFKDLYNRFKDHIINHRFTIHKKTKYIYEKYFGINTDVKIKKLKKELFLEIDDIDKIILKELSKNSRIDLVSLGKKTKISPQAVSKRIKRLEEANYIIKYYIFVDISKIDLYLYAVLINNEDKTTNERLINHLEFRKDVSYVGEYIGDPYLEFGLFVSSPYDLRKKLQEIIGLFKDIKIVQIDLFQKEYVSISLPECVFE
jgi:DNA-binding Lrp family transcriptional regulator